MYMAGNVYGIDLGSYEIRVYNKEEDKITTIKDSIAIKNRKNVIATGDEAYEMYEKAPSDIEIVFPMKEGVVSHFDDMQHILSRILKNTKNRFWGSKYLIAVPTDVTEVEKKAFYDILTKSITSGRSVYLVERSIADAVGFGIDIQNEAGACIINMGAETSEISILSSGGIVINKLVKLGGRHIDTLIQNQIKQKCDFAIGKLTSEKIRKYYGVNPFIKDKPIVITGTNLHVGVPELREVPYEIVEECILEGLNEIIVNLKAILDRTPPLIKKNIEHSGIYICGGASNLIGLKEYLEMCLNMNIHVDSGFQDNTVNGLSRIINNGEFKDLTYSMNDGNYRWMR